MRKFTISCCELKQVLMNGQYNSKTNYWTVKTACTALALQGLESRDSHKGFKILGQVQNNKNSVKKCERRLLRETIFEFKESRDSEK